MHLQWLNKQQWKRNDNKKRTNFWVSTSCLLCLKSQLQSCQLSLQPPVHSSDSGRTAHTWNPKNTSSELQETPMLDLIPEGNVISPLPDWHFQRIERVLESKIRIDLVDLPQERVGTRLPRVCQHNKLDAWEEQQRETAQFTSQSNAQRNLRYTHFGRSLPSQEVFAGPI